MKTGAFFLFSSFLLGLLSSAPRAEAEVLAATVQSPELAGFLGYLETHGCKVRRLVPAPSRPTSSCVPCLTTPTGYTICAAPTGTPEAPFCPPGAGAFAVQVFYERISNQP